MIFITTYRTKPFMTQDESKELMGIFAENGTGPGATAHYVAMDNSCGVVISENETAAEAYASILPYGAYVDYETKPMLTIDEALPHIIAALA